MSKVHYGYLDDMEKYNREFDRMAYENREEQEVITEFKEYYAKRLPVDLLTWCRVNDPADKMLWKEGYWNQIKFVRDRLNRIFYNNYEDYANNPVMVINTHTSKSIKLPVYEINLKAHGVVIVLRDNFYDWKVSVDSQKPIEANFMGLFNENEVINSCYCEGFKDNQVFGMFAENKEQFTIEIKDDYNLYTFMYLLNNYLCCRGVSAGEL